MDENIWMKPEMLRYGLQTFRNLFHYELIMNMFCPFSKRESENEIEVKSNLSSLQRTPRSFTKKSENRKERFKSLSRSLLFSLSKIFDSSPLFSSVTFTSLSSLSSFLSSENFETFKIFSLSL